MKGFELPEGVSDELFKEYKAKQDILDKIGEVFRSYGYRRVATPTIEYYDIFSSIKSTVLKEEMFKLVDKSGELLTLRPDATIPIARIVAKNYKKSKQNYKVCYTTQVFKMHSEQKRESTQTGIEYFGNPSPEADGEVISNAIESLIKCGVKFKIDIGNAGYYKGLLDETKLSEDIKEKLKDLIERKNFVEIRRYVEALELEDCLKKAIIEMPSLYGDFEEVIASAKELCLNERMKKSLEDLKNIYSIIADYGYSEYVSIDLGLINDLEYYTGVIFKGYLEGYGETILSGGRYDQLTEYYGEKIPATGFGISVDDLMNGMAIQGVEIEESADYVDYRVNYLLEERRNAISLAKELRSEGYTVELQRVNEFSDAVYQGSHIKQFIDVGNGKVDYVDSKNRESRD